jgi:hypothetical protein
VTSSLRRIVLPLVVAFLVMASWSSFLVYPLKIFVVFLHEISHGLAALATGGSIRAIGLTFDEGGVCVTEGGSRFLILNAGYLGSLVWGALLLVLAARTRRSREIVGGIGAFTLVVTLVYVRSAFGLAYGIVMGATLLLVAGKLPRAASDVLLTAIAVVSCLYAVVDVGSDVFLRTVPGSDASALARLTGLPSLFWGLVWAAVSVAVVGLALRAVARGPSLR